jgi:hypothetical protein
MQIVQLRIRQAGLARKQPQLVKGKTSMHFDGERAREDLEIQFAVIARSDVIEPRLHVRDDAGKDVETSGRAFRIGLGVDLGGQGQLF